MKKTLPRDIVQYVNKKITRSVFLFVALSLLSCGINIFAWEYFATKTTPLFHMSIVLLLCGAPFFVSGFPWKLIDKSWSGTVIDVLIEEEQGVNHTSAGRGELYVKNVIYLKVRKNNGKEKYIPVREFGIRRHKGFPVPNEGDVTNHLNDYSIGDSVYHFYGLKHCFVVKKNSEMLDCVICGAQNQKGRKNCLNCGHSLIKKL